MFAIMFVLNQECSRAHNKLNVNMGLEVFETGLWAAVETIGLMVMKYSTSSLI